MDEITTDYYWDCECEENYIHPKSDMICPFCGSIAIFQPDSIKTEVAEMLCGDNLEAKTAIMRLL